MLHFSIFSFEKAIRDLIKEVLPKANEKYHLLLEHYIVSLSNEF